MAALTVALALAWPSAGVGAVSQTTLANGCFALRVPGAGFVQRDGDTYAATASGAAQAERFWLKPTDLRLRYLLQDRSGALLTAAGDATTAQSAPGPAARWRLERLPGLGAFDVTHGQRLLASGRGGSLRLSSARITPFDVVPAAGCTPYPEAGTGARGKPFSGTNPDGTVSGFADTHLHITANLRAGGRVIDGEPFDPFGITEALGHDEVNHGADGSEDVTGNLLRDGVPFGTHDTRGWPTFAGWPVNDTNTHQQIYYRWLERVYDAGLRLVVAQTVEDQPLCRIEPQRAHSCSETHTIKLEVQQLRGLQDYVDAQSGGLGKGWFRLVRNPRQARRVIADGKLGVVIGVESSDPFDCSLNAGCTRKDVDRGLDRMERLGVRSMFIAHWVDNAFAGSALEGGVKGVFINIFEHVETGHYFSTGPCPDPSQGEEVTTLSPAVMQILTPYFPATAGLPPMPEYPDGKQCNSVGLTPLGAYLVRQMMKRGMLVEVDHMSEHARNRVLAIAAAHHYPLVSSHNGTGGSWTPAELDEPLQGRRVRLGHPGAGSGAGAEDRVVQGLPRARPLLRRGPRHRHRRLLVAARAARRRGHQPARLPVQVGGREGHVHARAHRRAHLRPQHRRRRALRAVRRPDRRHGAQPRWPGGDEDAVPLGRGLPADVGARALAALSGW